MNYGSESNPVSYINLLGFKNKEIIKYWRVKKNYLSNRIDILSNEYLKIKVNATNIPEYASTICMIFSSIHSYTQTFQSLFQHQDMGNKTIGIFCRLSSFPYLIF